MAWVKTVWVESHPYGYVAECGRCGWTSALTQDKTVAGARAAHHGCSGGGGDVAPFPAKPLVGPPFLTASAEAEPEPEELGP